MHTWKAWLACIPLLASVGFLAFSLTHGQERSTPSSSTSGATAIHTPASSRDGTSLPTRDLSKLPQLHQQMYLSAARGGGWLFRANRADGRFVNGYLPALKAPLEGDHYLRQVGAAYALAQVARFLGDEKFTAVARQAVLTLLLDTALSPNDSPVRHTTLPSVVVNRLAAAGWLILAINELPSPGEDLLEQSEQLCAFLRKQQGADGALSYVDPGVKAELDPDGINHHPGAALFGLMRSQRYRPAAWKTEVVRKALPYYRSWWRAHKTMTFVPWQTAAYAEAYLRTKEPPFADFVQEMNDWLCELQYTQLDPRHPLWGGGFMEWVDGKPRAEPPLVGSALYAESLVAACRVARQTGDVNHYQRYRESLERCLQFLTTLQYMDANTQHFADWYRPVLVGAFHGSHEDGNLRIDYTQHAVCALVQYLAYVGELVSGEW
jgi:hypothetical protein